MFRDVPECSGMFRDVPCSWFYQRPYFLRPWVEKINKVVLHEFGYMFNPKQNVKHFVFKAVNWSKFVLPVWLSIFKHLRNSTYSTDISVNQDLAISSWNSTGGEVSPRKSVHSPAASMTSRLASVTFKMASKVFIEETDKNFDFITKILFRFLGFGDFKVSIVTEN